MANFHTNQSSLAVVKYADNGMYHIRSNYFIVLQLLLYYLIGTAFTAVWAQVPLHESQSKATEMKHNLAEQNVFTFGVTLLSTGDIIFAYKNVAMPIRSLKEKSNVVKIGLSDAYYIYDKRTNFFRISFENINSIAF